MIENTEIHFGREDVCPLGRHRNGLSSRSSESPIKSMNGVRSGPPSSVSPSSWRTVDRGSDGSDSAFGDVPQQRRFSSYPKPVAAVVVTGTAVLTSTQVSGMALKLEISNGI